VVFGGSFTFDAVDGVCSTGAIAHDDLDLGRIQ
jgi:hypothetical protein